MSVQSDRLSILNGFVKKKYNAQHGIHDDEDVLLAVGYFQGDILLGNPSDNSWDSWCRDVLVSRGFWTDELEDWYNNRNSRR